jgi:hypothetical protein
MTTFIEKGPKQGQKAHDNRAGEAPLISAKWPYASRGDVPPPPIL